MAVSRREFITSATATAIAGRVVTGTVSAKPTSDAQVVIVYDDGPVTDYTKAFPVHKDEGVPASMGIVSTWVGTGGSESMRRASNKKELAEMESFGFEIMSHTREHSSLVSFPLLKDVSPDDTHVYPKGKHTSHPFDTRYQVEIYDDNQSVLRTVAGSGRDDNGDLYMILNKPVGKSFSADTARERLSAKSMRYALGDSKKKLESYGFTVDNLLAPFDEFSDYSKRFAKEHYMGVANSVEKSGVNPRDNLTPFGTQRDYFIEYTDWGPIKDQLDTIAQTNALGIFGAHTQKDEVTPKKIRRMIRAAKDRNIEIVTLRKALEDAGFNPPNGSAKNTTTTPTARNTTTTTTSSKSSTTTTSTNNQTTRSTSDITSLTAGQPGFDALAGIGGLAGLGVALNARTDDEE